MPGRPSHVAADRTLFDIVLLSLEVSLSAVAAAAAIGLPLGAAIAVGRFPGRQALLVALNALMGLPPVVVGLLVYLLLSRAGPLGELGLLFTPPAMVIAQTVLVLPIIAALARQSVEDAWREYEEQLRSLGVTACARALHAAVGHPLLAAHGGAWRDSGAPRGSRRRDDRRRQHRRRDARDDHDHRARDLQGRPAARARASASCSSPSCSRSMPRRRSIKSAAQRRYG